MRIVVFLLAQLGQDHSHLVRDFRDAIIVGAGAPIGKLSRDRETLLAGGLVGGDDVVLRFDQLEELLG